MKRQNFRTPIVVSGIFFFTLLVALTGLYQMTNQEPQWTELFKRERLIEAPPMARHWLRTEADRWYEPSSLEINKGAKKAYDDRFGYVPSITLEEARSRLNRQTEAINILYIWTDDDKLRVISLTCFNKKTRQAAVVVIPLHTVVNNGNVVNLEKSYMTLQNLYREKGREGVREFVQKQFEINIPNFVHVNQTALRKISEIVGGLKVNGDDVTMLEAFEQTEAGIRTDDRDVVGAVANQILKPRMLFEIPKLLWIFTHDIKTNFSTEQMISLFHYSRQMDLANMRKTALPGREHVSSGFKYLFVSQQTWKNLIYEITR